MSPVYSVTDVAGLDHPTFSPHAGRRSETPGVPYDLQASVPRPRYADLRIGSSSAAAGAMSFLACE